MAGFEFSPDIIVPDSFCANDLKSPDPRKLKYFDGDLTKFILENSKINGEYFESHEIFLDSGNIAGVGQDPELVIKLSREKGFSNGLPFDRYFISRLIGSDEFGVDFILSLDNDDETVQLWDNIDLGANTFFSREAESLKIETKELKDSISRYDDPVSEAFLESLGFVERLANGHNIPPEQFKTYINNALSGEMDTAKITTAEMLIANNLGVFALRCVNLVVKNKEKTYFKSEEILVSGLANDDKSISVVFYNSDRRIDNEKKRKTQKRNIVFSYKDMYGEVIEPEVTINPETDVVYGVTNQSFARLKERLQNILL